MDNVITNIDILILESLLGSDYRKQLYSYLKLRNGAKHWDVLFERKFVFNHLGHEIELSKEELNPEYSKLIMNIISFGDERNNGIFKKKSKSDPEFVDHDKIKEE